MVHVMVDMFNIFKKKEAVLVNVFVSVHVASPSIIISLYKIVYTRS